MSALAPRSRAGCNRPAQADRAGTFATQSSSRLKRRLRRPGLPGRGLRTVDPSIRVSPTYVVIGQTSTCRGHTSLASLPFVHAQMTEAPVSRRSLGCKREMDLGQRQRGGQPTSRPPAPKGKAQTLPQAYYRHAAHQPYSPELMDLLNSRAGRYNSHGENNGILSSDSDGRSTSGLRKGLCDASRSLDELLPPRLS